MKKKIFYLAFIGLLICLCSCSGRKMHEHDYEENWTFDSNYHWHEAKCCDGETTTKENHTFDDGTMIESTFEEKGTITYTCSVCGFQRLEYLDLKEHNYASEYSYDDVSHWYSCIDEDYEVLRDKEEKHTDSNEVILISPTEDSTGLAEYTCTVCNHTYQKVLLIQTYITSLPDVNEEIVYVGQILGDLELNGGLGNVSGHFEWSNPEEIITGSGEYEVSFIPDAALKYGVATGMVMVDAEQLTVTINVGDNGAASSKGNVNVNYNGELVLDFIADTGYQVSEVLVNGVSVGASASYTLSNITSNYVIEVIFEEKQSFADLPYEINCLSGSIDCFILEEDEITFTKLSENSVYSISGEFAGSIIIDIGDDYNFDLELHGFNLSASKSAPIIVLSGNKVSITAKKEYVNNIYDLRATVDSADETQISASIYSIIDLEICGKGTLNVESDNNNGIHSKDDLVVKNLTLSITCKDNALKGNDSVSISNCTTMLIATQGDCIKTTNSDISTKGNQRGSINISGGVHNLYAACDGIDAAYDVVIDDSTTQLNIYTDKYSQYSEEVTSTSEDTYYLRYSSSAYKFSVKYYNSDSDYLWVNADFYQTVNAGSSNYYYYKFVKHSEYSKLIVYMYSSSQTLGQDSNYYACSSNVSINDSYDTIALSYRQNKLSVSWTNYTSSSAMPGFPGGMEEGNTDKGDYSTKGIKAANQIIINNGVISINSYDDAIHANQDTTLENGESPLGNVTINNGEISIYSNDDGIHADGTLSINGGNITISNCYEGLEGTTIIINSGNISIKSLDDGINGGGTTGQSIIINDGNIYIYAQGDGIDSNSTSSYSGILFSGGNVVVICNSNGNSAIDSERGYKYTGGRVVAIMPSGGMTSEASNCSNFSSIGTKSNLSLQANSYLTVTVSSTVTAVIKMPCSMQTTTIYLGSSSASLASVSSNSNTLDANGVYWK